MKKIYLIILFVFGFGFAQAPQKMSYQAVVRDAAGSLVVNTAIGERISILSGSVSGTAVYVETHTTVTNANGLMSIEIGGGAPQTGTFAAINWANGPYFVKTETDPNGGSNYSITGTSQLLSVPYALYAENTKPMGRTTIYLKGDITDAQAAAKIAIESGPFTENIIITNTTQLTTVTFSNIPSLLKLNIINNAVLATVNIDLETIEGELKVTGNPSLTGLSMPSLKQVGGVTDIFNNSQMTTLNLPLLSEALDRITVYGNNLGTFNLPSLVKLVRGLSVYGVNIQSIDVPLLQTIIRGGTLFPTVDSSSGTYIKVGSSVNTTAVSFPSLTSIPSGNLEIAGIGSLNIPVYQYGGIQIDNGLLTSFTAPSLIEASITIKTSNNLTSINLPSLTSASFYITDNAALTSISIPACTTLAPSLYVVSFKNNNLPSAAVNYLLSRLVSINPSGKIIYIKQLPPAPPTGQGLIDKNFLDVANEIYTD